MDLIHYLNKIYLITALELAFILIYASWGYENYRIKFCAILLSSVQNLLR